MRYLFVFSMIICSFCLPGHLIGFAMGQAETKVTPLSSLMDKLDSNEKQAYQEFCDSMTSYHDQLNQLIESDTSDKSDPENEWRNICSSARTDIKRARMSIINMVGGKHHDEGVKWFRILMSIFAKMEGEGTKAFNVKMELDRLMAKKDRSLKRNRGIKKDYQEDIDYLDESVEYANSYISAGSKEDWKANFEAENSGKDFLGEFAADANYAYNLGEAAVKGGKIATENAKSDEPDKYKGGEKHLAVWEIENEVFYFANFKNTRSYWQSLIIVQHTEYDKLYEKWYDELEWIFQSTMFNGTDNMRDWKWNNLGTKFTLLLEKID